MSLRIQQLAVLVFWLASMSWLVATKLLPVTTLSQPPDHRLVGPGTDRFPNRVTWQIECDGQAVGTAETTMNRPHGGTPTVHSIVQLRNFPLGKMLGPFLDTWSQLTGVSGLTQDNLDLSVEVRTLMQFSEYGELQLFLTDVDLDQIESFLHIRGTRIKEDRLQIIVSTKQKSAARRSEATSYFRELLRQDFRVPAGALIIDGFIPHPRLARLRVGQEWTMQSFRSFSPTNAIRPIHCQVLRLELAPWDREMEPMFVVTMNDATPGGLTAVQASSILLWVRHDGTVVRQQMQLGGVQIDFHRMSDASSAETEGSHDPF